MVYSSSDRRPHVLLLTSSIPAPLLLCVVLAFSVGLFFCLHFPTGYLALATSALAAGSPFSQLITSPPPSLAKGKFLVASQELRDSNFAESVVLLTDYSEEGAVGVIINRPTPVPLHTLLPKVAALQKRKDVVYFGGPVARHMMIILVRSQTAPPGTQPVVADLYLVSQQEALEQLLRTNGKNTKLRAYIGHAGWAPGQLDMEVAHGSWHVVPADIAMIFAEKTDKVWPELLRRGDALWTLRPQQSQPVSLTLMARD